MDCSEVLLQKSLGGIVFSFSSLGISSCSKVEGSFRNFQVVEEGLEVVTACEDDGLLSIILLMAEQKRSLWKPQ